MNADPSTDHEDDAVEYKRGPLIVESEFEPLNGSGPSRVVLLMKTQTTLSADGMI